MTPSPIAAGTRWRSRTSFRIPSGMSENAWSVPFAVWLAVKCFSITRAPSMYATGRHRDAVLVVRQADDELRVALAVRRDHAELELLDGGRVRRRALQQAELRVDRRDGLDGAVDVLDRRAAGGDDQRLADRGDMPQERRVAQVAGRDLVRRDVELGEQVGARLVERRREEHEAELAGARLQLDVGAAIELERLAVGAVRRAEAVLVVVGAVVERAREQPPVVALLELDRVHARLLREHEQLLRLLDRALMVVADLGDDEAGRVVGDPAAVDLELAHRAIVPLRFAGARADTERVRSETADRVAPVASSLSILMPVYNELATVERAIDDALTAELPVESRQLVLVDDGSKDGTRELLQDRELPENVTLVLHERNRGKGAALQTALQHATGTWSAVLDADLEYRASDLGPLLEPLLSGAGERRLRHALVVEPLRVQLLVRDGEQGRDVRDERDLQLLDLGRHDLPQGDVDRALPLAAPPGAGILDRAGDRRAGAPLGRADLRGADLVRGAVARGGQEAHGPRRGSRATHAPALQGRLSSRPDTPRGAAPRSSPATPS